MRARIAFGLPGSLLLACLLSGCIVAAEKPDFDTSIVSGTTVEQALPAADQPANTSPNKHQLDGSIRVIVPPVTCYGLLDDTALAGASNAKDLRNSCVLSAKTEIHESYIRYRRQIAKQVGLTEEGLDVVSGAASASSAATTKVAAKVLSALAAVATGTRTAFDSDALYKQSLNAIFKQMDADVAKSGAEIDASTQLSYDSYTIGQARFDLLEYYNAGLIQHALDNLDATAGTAKTTCAAAQTQVAKAVSHNAKLASSSNSADEKASTSTTDQCSKLLDSATTALKADYDFGQNGQALLALLYPKGKFDVSVYKQLQACMTSLKYPGEPIFFINGGIAQTAETQSAASDGTAEDHKAKVLGCIAAGTSK